MEISDYAHYAALLSLLLKSNLWLHSLHCFIFTTIKMKPLTKLTTTLFYFTTTNPRDRTTLTTLLLSLIHEIVFPQEFQCFHKICMCHSYFTVRKFSGVLHTVLPDFSTKIKNTYINVTDFFRVSILFIWNNLKNLTPAS